MNLICEYDVIHQHVSPLSGVLVDDLDPGPATLKLADVEDSHLECFAVLARGRAHDRVVDEEVDAGLTGVVAAADQKSYALTFDGERPGHELPRRGVTGAC